MSIYINYPFGGSGGSGNDPTKLPLAGGTLTGLVYASTIGFRNPLNQNFVIDAYNDTGAGTHNYFKFNPYGGGLELPTNSSGIKFGDGTNQVTSALPLTGGTLTGNLNVDNRASGADGPWAQVQSGRFYSIDTDNNREAYFDTNSFVITDNLGTFSELGSGKLSLVQSGTTTPSLRLPTGITPASSVAGDIWLTAGSMRYKDSTGTERIIADTNRANTYTTNNTFQNSSSNPTVTITASGSGTALKVTNTGTGESFRVEDETSPDATPFVISNSGRAGIGIAPDATVALRVDSTGIKFNTTTFNPTGTQAALVSYALYDKEILITVNGTNYALLARTV
jgi:hypothetical protein